MGERSIEDLVGPSGFYEKRGETGVLLIHGLTGTPAEMTHFSRRSSQAVDEQNTDLAPLFKKAVGSDQFLDTALGHRRFVSLRLIPLRNDVAIVQKGQAPDRFLRW